MNLKDDLAQSLAQAVEAVFTTMLGADIVAGEATFESGTPDAQEAHVGLPGEQVGEANEVLVSLGEASRTRSAASATCALTRKVRRRYHRIRRSFHCLAPRPLRRRLPGEIEFIMSQNDRFFFER